MPKRTHGEVKSVNGKRCASTEYRSWQMMKNRCANRKAADYAYYGARGITFDARWARFENFIADMGRKPTPKHTLERVNNSKGYAKDNCIWATRKDQARNRGRYNNCSLERANAIRNLYATGRYYQYEIAAMYGLTQAQVSKVTRNELWA